MENRLLSISTFFSLSLLFCVQAEEPLMQAVDQENPPAAQENPPAAQEKEQIVAVTCPEPSFKERQWEKKKIKGSERIDHFITLFLIIAFGNQTTSTYFFNPFPLSIKKQSGKVTAFFVLAKVGITLWRMHLHDIYVGGNPLKLVPSFVYFTLVDMASWRWK